MKVDEGQETEREVAERIRRTEVDADCCLNPFCDHPRSYHVPHCVFSACTCKKFSAIPTLEEAEAILRKAGIDPKDVVNQFIDRLLHDNADLRSQLAAESWRCFHCDEVLTTRESAAEHFGDGNYEYEPPLCVEAATTDKRKLVLNNRELWELLQKANAEVEELTDKLGGLEQVVSKATGIADPTSHDLHLAIQRAEEAGYAKGLQDAPMAIKGMQ